MIYEFTIPGKPVGKQRPKFGNGRTYTPEMTVNYENLTKICFKQAYPNAEPIAAGTPIAAVVIAYYAIPQSTSKRRKDMMTAGLILPMVKPDVDNVSKSVLDALNRIAYYDDAQIVQLTALKRYSDEPKVVVRLMEYTEFLKLCSAGGTT